MKNRLIAITLMMAVLLALFVLMPGTVSADVEPPPESSATEPDVAKPGATKPVVTGDTVAFVDVATYIAVTFTAFAGIVNVVLELFAFAKVTPSEVVHLSNTFPLGAAFALMVTVLPFS